MLLTQLELYNFLAYRAPHPIDLTGIGLACLSGPNGAGKSSLLDAITWALWGKARAKSDDDLIHIGQTEMRVSVEFDQDGRRYRVERQRKLKGASGKLRLLARADDTTWHVLFDGMRDTQPQIIRLLRLNYETFVNSAYLQQGKADAFTTRTAKERRDILREILGLDEWTTYEKRAKEKQDACDEERRNHESAIREKDAEIAREPIYQQELAEAENRLLQAKAARAEAEAAFERVRGADNRMRETVEQITNLYTRARNIQRELTVTDEEIARKDRTLQERMEAVAHSEEIESGYAALEQARSTDADFGKRERRWNELNNKREKLLNKLEREADKLEQEAAAYRKSIQKAEAQITDWEPLQARVGVLEGLTAQLALKREDYDTAQAQIENLKVELSAIQAQNQALAEATEELRANWSLLKDPALAVCPVCRQPLNEEQRVRLLADFKQEGDANNALLSANEGRIGEIQAARKALETAVRAATQELRRQDEYQTELAKGRARMDVMAKAAEDAARERTILAGLEQRLAQEDFGHDLRLQIAGLEAEIDAIGYDRDAHAETTTALAELRGYEARMHDLRTAREQIPDLQVDLQAAAARRERLLADQSAVNGEIARLEAQRKVIEEDVQQEALRQAELSEARKQEANQSQRVGGAKQALTSVDNARAKRKELHGRLEEASRKWQVYRRLREAFSQSGIPAMMIEAAIPELEQQANKYLSMISDGQMQVRFVTQKENKSGSVVEALDIVISDALGSRDYSLYSGGESFRVNFAVRVALSQFLARRAGAQLRTLFIDEGFGSQDAFGRERLVEAINRIREEFELILVVTHIDELRDAFQNHIRVTKGSAGSQVELITT